MRWEVKPLGEVCDFQRGLTFSKSDRVDAEGTQVLRATNLSLETGKLTFDDVIQISSDFEIPNERKINGGSVLVCTSSGSRSHLGKACLIESSQNVAFGGFLGMLNPRNGIYGKYLFFNLRGRNYQKFLDSIASGANINNLRWNQLREFEIPIPPLEEQERIVEVLDEAFAAIDKAKANIERNLTNARELFQSRLNDIFSNPSEDWEVKPLGEMTRTGAGGTPLKSNSTFYEPPEVPWLLSGEVGQREIHRVKNQISTLGLENSSAKLFPINSVLVAMYGATAGEVGVLKVETATNQAVCAIYPCEKIGHDFIYFFMLFFKDALVAQAVGGAQPNVSQAKIKAIRIPVPPLTEQDRIVNELNALSKMRENLETKYQTELDNLEELRQSILKQAFEGKLTEPVAA